MKILVKEILSKRKFSAGCIKTTTTRDPLIHLGYMGQSLGICFQDFSSPLLRKYITSRTFCEMTFRNDE